jgi:hypothetical protein
MSSSDTQARLLIFGTLGIFVVLWLLGVILCREWVKKDLRARGFQPLRVTWRPLGWWRGYYGCCFMARYKDSAGRVHEGRCWTGGFRRGVAWKSDEIVSNDDAAWRSVSFRHRDSK